MTATSKLQRGRDATCPLPQPQPSCVAARLPGTQPPSTLPTLNRPISAAESCRDQRTRLRGSAPGPLELCSAKVMLGHAVAVGGQPLMEVPQPWGLMWLSIHTLERSGASV